MSTYGAGDIRSRMSRFEGGKSATTKPFVAKTKPPEKTNGETNAQKEPEPAPAPAAAPAKKKFEMPKREKCRVCNISVYEMEKLVADEIVYHKTCFKCKKCRNTLRVGNYASLDGQVFCKPHFKELFKLKGNYEEGFGKQRHKNKWLNKQGSTDSQPSSRNNSKQGTPEPISSSTTHNSRKNSLPDGGSQSTRQRVQHDEEEKENKPSAPEPATKKDQTKPGVGSRFNKGYGADKSAVAPPKPKPKAEVPPPVVQPADDAGDGMDVDESETGGVVTTDPIQVGNMKARFEMEMKRAAAGGAPVSEARKDLEAMRAASRGAMKSRYEDALTSGKEMGQGDGGEDEAEEDEQPKPRARLRNNMPKTNGIDSTREARRLTFHGVKGGIKGNIFLREQGESETDVPMRNGRNELNNSDKEEEEENDENCSDITSEDDVEIGKSDDSTNDVELVEAQSEEENDSDSGRNITENNDDEPALQNEADDLSINETSDAWEVIELPSNSEKMDDGGSPCDRKDEGSDISAEFRENLPSVNDSALHDIVYEEDSQLEEDFNGQRQEADGNGDSDDAASDDENEISDAREDAFDDQNGESFLEEDNEEDNEDGYESDPVGEEDNDENDTTQTSDQMDDEYNTPTPVNDEAPEEESTEVGQDLQQRQRETVSVTATRNGLGSRGAYFDTPRPAPDFPLRESIDSVGGGRNGDDAGTSGSAKRTALSTNMQNLLSRFKAIESGEKKAGHVVISDDEDDEESNDKGNTSIRDELKTMKKASKFRSFFETVSQTGEGGRYSEDEEEDESMEVDNPK